VGENTPNYYADAARSDEAACAGDYSLKTSDEWASVTFNNPTNDDVWAPVTEGTIELYWKYVPPWGCLMLFQVTGKSSNPSLDTNDGIGLSTRLSAPGVFELGMGWDGGGTSTFIRSPALNLVEGAWYRFRIRYRVNGSPSLSLQIDDLPPTTSSDPLGPTACPAWHQILIGNDLGDIERCMPYGVQYIDEFRIYDSWLDDGTEPPDAGPSLPPDAAIPPDAGPGGDDAGLLLDAATPTVPRDGGVLSPDARERLPDAGDGSEEPDSSCDAGELLQGPEAGQGCGCTGAPGTPGTMLVLAGVLGALRRRARG